MTDETNDNNFTPDDEIILAGCYCCAKEACVGLRLDELNVGLTLYVFCKDCFPVGPDEVIKFNSWKDEK